MDGERASVDLSRGANDLGHGRGWRGVASPRSGTFNEFVTVVEEVCGRKVRSYLSETVTAPEAILEIFYLEPVDEIGDRIALEALEDEGEVERPLAGIPDGDGHGPTDGAGPG
jgi:hypothetical protein